MLTVRFEMRELLGAGGMGQVYRAYDPRLRREVALKLLRGSREEVGERALREARCQARVAHPNVCQIFEIGEDDGKVFIAMQLVRGRTLGQAAADLDLRQRVTVVREVAEAVQAAHGSGLVHRDLKPSNVLVEMVSPAGDEDGIAPTPHPWVVDFGLARGHDAPELTATGYIVGTPAYLAPELLLGQAEADRRSDIYGVGAILYEVLAGRAPYVGTSSIGVLSQVLRAPPPPVRSLAPDLPRDLELIVAKSMDREPSRRYGSARLLAEDLDRFLAGEPVLARPPSLAYRTTLWLVRHRALASITAAFLLLGLIGAVRYTLDLRAEHRRTEAARLEAEQVASFLEGIFASADPRESQGRSPTVREVLDRASRRLAVELEDGSETRARLDSVLGSIYLQLGDQETAEEHLGAALRAIEQRQGPDAPESTEVLERLAQLRRWQSKLDEATELWQRSLDLRRRHGIDPTAALLGLGGLATERSDFVRGRELLEEVVRLRRREDDPERLVTPLFELARLEREAGNLDRAEELFEESLAVQSDDGDALNRARTLNNLGMLYHDRGRLAEAMSHFERAVELRRRILGDTHPSVASALSNLGRSARHAGDYEKATDAYEEVLRIYRETLAPDHYWVGIVLNNLGRLHRDLGALDLAADELDRSIEILRASVGERQPRTHYSILNRALVDLDRGAYARAGERLERAVADLRQLVGAENPAVAIGLESLARSRHGMAGAGAAEPALRQALAIYLQAYRPGDPRTERCRVRLAHVLAEQGRDDEARRLADQTVRALASEIEGSDEPRPAIALADAYLVLGRLERRSGAAPAADLASAGLALIERWTVEASALEWLELRADLLDLAGRPLDAESLRARLLERGYLPLGRVALAQPVGEPQAVVSPDSNPS